MADASVLVEIVGKETVSVATGQASSALSGLTGALGHVAEAAVKTTVALAAIGGAAAVAGLVASVGAAKNFEQQMSAVTSVMSKAELAANGGSQALQALALQLGKDTSYSATEAAKGLEELAKAGVSVKDIMGGGARAALDLAAAGGVEVATAAEVASDAMNVFGKSGAEMAHVADQIAGAANASAIGVNDYKYSLSAAGAVAATVGVSFEDLNTAIAMMGNSGIKGSDAGTSLKTMLLNLQPSTKAQREEFQKLGIVTADGANAFFTAEGKAKSLAEIAGVLQTATAGMTDQQKLASLEIMFGTDAIRAAAVMTKTGAEGFTKLANAIGEVSANDVANERLNNLAGSLEKLKGSVETGAISIGLKFTPVLKRLADVATDQVNKAIPVLEGFAEVAAQGFSDLIDSAIEVAPAFFEGMQAVGVFASALFDFARGAIPSIISAIQSLWTRITGGTRQAQQNITTFARQATTAFQSFVSVATRVGTVVADAIVGTFQFLTQRVLPPVLSIVRQTGQVFFNVLLPAAQRTGEVMRGILGDALDWLARTVWPSFLSIVTQTSNFFTRVILPTLPQVAATLRTALGETVQWLATTVWPALTAAATVAWNFISGTIVPQIPPLARLLRDVLGTAIEWVGTTGWPMLVAGATVAWNFLNEKVIPIIGELITWLKDKLPPVVNGVLTVFEGLRSKLSPVIQAVFSGDIKDALRKLGTAFMEFAELAAGWIGDQVSEIDWGEIWENAKGVAADLYAYLSKQAVNFVGWLSDQVEKIDWARIWEQTKGVAADLYAYLRAQAVNFAGWLGEQVGKINWGSIWQNIKDAAQQLYTYLSKQAVDFAKWLGEQVQKIPWGSVWQNIKDAAQALYTYLSKQAVDFTGWLKQEVGNIKWNEVWAAIKLTARDIMDAVVNAVTGLDAALTAWLNQQIRDIKWAELGDLFGRSIITSAQQGADQAGGEAGNLDTGALKAGLFTFLDAAMKGAWEEALAAWRVQEPGRTYGAVFVEGLDTGGVPEAVKRVFGLALSEYITFQLDWNAKVSAGLEDLVKAFAQWGGRVLYSFGQLQEALWGVWGSIWDGLWGRAGEALDAIWGLINQKGADIVGALSNWVPEWAKAGAAMASALLGPIGPAIDSIRRMLPGGGGDGRTGLSIPSGGGGGGSGVTQRRAPTHSSQYLALINKIAAETGEDPALIAAIMDTEGSPADSTSPAGARGLMQVLPNYVFPGEDPFDPETSIRQGIRAIQDKRAILQSQGYEATPEQIAGRYFGQGVDAGGMTTEGYRQRFRGNYENYVPAGRTDTPMQGAPADLPPMPGGAGESSDLVWVQGKYDKHWEDRAYAAANPGEYQVIYDPKAAVQQAGQRTNLRSVGRPMMNQMAIGNQFEMGLSPAAAAAACGPAAAAIFMQATGRTPNAQEVMEIAAKNGWSAGKGMGSGPRGFMGMLGDLGVEAAVDYTPTEGELQQAVQGGALTAISTSGGAGKPLDAGHYFVAQGYNAETGEYDLGETGGPDPTGEYKNAALKGGSRFMTLAQIEALAGPMNAIITLADSAGQSFAKMGDDVGVANDAAGDMQPALEGVGNAIDPVVASFSEGSTTVSEMTDAIISSAAEQGVATETADAYSQGLIGQDEAMRGVLEGFAATTPAAADLLAQLDAGAISTEEAAVAFAGLATTTADAASEITTSAEGMGEDVTTALEGMADDGVTAAETLGEDSLVAIEGLADDGLTALEDLGADGVEELETLADDGITAAEDLNDDSVKELETLAKEGTQALEDLNDDSMKEIKTLAKDSVRAAEDMNEDMVEEFETLAEDGARAAEDLNKDVLDEIESMAQDGVNEMEDFNRDAVSEMEAMAEDVASETEQMARDVVENVESLAQDSVEQFEEFGDSVQDAAGEIEDLADAIQQVDEPVALAFSADVPSTVNVDGINVDDLQSDNTDLGNVDMGNIRAGDVEAGDIEADDLDAEDTTLRDVTARNMEAPKGEFEDAEIEDSEITDSQVEQMDVENFDAPGRARGGPVSARKAYWVGEHGRPELFVSDEAGHIFANAEALQDDSTGVGMDYDMLALALMRAVSEYRGTNAQRNYNLTVNTSAPHEPIIHDFAVLEALARSTT